MSHLSVSLWLLVMSGWYHLVGANSGGVSLQIYNSTAIAGAVLFNGSVPTVGFPGVSMPATSSYTALWTGTIVPPTSSELVFGVQSDIPGYARLWVDDRLLMDTSFDGTKPPVPFNADYLEWPSVNIDTPEHSMKDDGGDCGEAECGTLEKCSQKCDSLSDKGCIGFVTSANQGKVQWCYMRKLAPGQINCSDAFEVANDYTTFTRNQKCSFAPGWSPVNVSNHANFAVPVPFLHGAAGARFRLEYTAQPTQTAQAPDIILLVNGTRIDPNWLIPNTPLSERQYFAEREEAEVGWNTWLSGDMLTHAYLPHGIGVRLILGNSTHNLTWLGEDGPACDRNKFPVTHGLHATRGQYTELSSVDFNGGSFQIQSATVPNQGGGEIGATNVFLVTVIKEPLSTTTLSVLVEVPYPWKPRRCDIEAVEGLKSSALVVADCPGLPGIFVNSKDSSATPSSRFTGFNIDIPQTLGSSASLYAYFPSKASDPLYTTEDATKIMASGRASLEKRYSKYGSQNETFAGMSMAVSWNVIFTPYEGIFIPVFRGSPWSVSRPHNYVLFEWDTFLSSMIAVRVDNWVAKSNIIRMTKSLIAGVGGGYVPGFWNGLCGEVDKSKPPVGGIALKYLIDNDPSALWVADLLVDQFYMWNQWWNIRMHNNLVSPGSTRSMTSVPFACENQSPVHASMCETGLDNSPIYDGATFINTSNTIDSVDVGMSALLASDSLALAHISSELGDATLATEFQQRARSLSTSLNTSLWDDENGLFFNRMWTPNNSWAPKVAAPTSFYPMIASIPSDIQVIRMMERWLTNCSELGVGCQNISYGIPSVSRSNNAFHDNNYWRGRAWGPMNWLVYLGLRNYMHIPQVKAAASELAAQSEATFLIEWIENHRVMENYNSVTGVGCDVVNANPFYHWGALTALTALDEAGVFQ